MSCSLLDHAVLFPSCLFEGKAKLPFRRDQCIIVAYCTDKGGPSHDLIGQVAFLLTLFQPRISSLQAAVTTVCISIVLFFNKEVMKNTEKKYRNY